MIFDSVDMYLGYLSKYVIFPIFYHQFIVQFDQFLKDLSRKYLIFMWIRPLFTIIPLNSNYFLQIGKFGLCFDTRPCEIDDLLVSSRHLYSTNIKSRDGEYDGISKNLMELNKSS